ATNNNLHIVSTADTIPLPCPHLHYTIINIFSSTTTSCPPRLLALSMLPHQRCNNGDVSEVVVVGGDDFYYLD
ncbi:unnamed protein product, partial [Ilex paraguariensis]